MLTAVDAKNGSILVLPAFSKDQTRLESLRERTRAGEALCPGCEQALWLKAGDERIAHFSHRKLGDCPRSSVSVEVLTSRVLLYEFFQSRIDKGQLDGHLELEPVLSPLPGNNHVDLLLRRNEKRTIAIVISQKQVGPDTRYDLTSAIQYDMGFEFRPVSLQSRLKTVSYDENLYLLDTTLRYWSYQSPYGLPPSGWETGETLHFIDPFAEKWKTLRGLWIKHSPQGYAARSVAESGMSDLLWSEVEADWVHPGETKASGVKPTPSKSLASIPPKPKKASILLVKPSEIKIPAPVPPPALKRPDLMCENCGVWIPEADWQMAKPGEGVCICRDCFGAGARFSASRDISW